MKLFPITLALLTLFPAGLASAGHPARTKSPLFQTKPSGSAKPLTGWKAYTPPNGKFHVSLPGKPTAQPAANGGNTHLWVLDHDGLRYVLGYTDIPSAAASKPSELLAGAKQGAVGTDKKLLAERAITVSGAPGKELKIEIPGQDGSAAGVMIAQFVVAKKRLFNVLITIPTGREARRETAAFLNSFKLDAGRR